MRMGKFLFATLPDDAPEPIRALLAIWRKKRVEAGGRRGDLPKMSQFEATDWSRFEPNIALAHYSYEHEDVYVFIAGEALDRMFGASLSERWFSEIFSRDQIAVAMSPYRASARVRRPTYSETDIGPTTTLARLVLPVLSREDGVEFIVAVYDISRPSAKDSEAQLVNTPGSAIEQRRFLILSVDLVHTDDRSRELRRVLGRVRMGWKS